MLGHETSQLESLVLASWPNLARARTETQATRSRLAAIVQGLDSEDLSIVAFGSLGRGEFTAGSDLDWTLLVDGAADPDHFEQALRVADGLKSGKAKDPGREGTFGKLVYSHDLVHRIGGEDDTNSNTTRRSLMLLEAVALGRDEAFERVTKAILRRYLLEDSTFVARTAKYRVPRFLLNDFARYWRTMAVDFAYKRRRRQGKGAAVRNLKLRFSRKLLFASALIACFSFELGLAQPQSATVEEAELVDALRRFLHKTPLDMLASAFLLLIQRSSPQQAGRSHDVARAVFETYDAFLGELTDTSTRAHLEALEPASIDTDPTFQRLRICSHRFRDGILDLFFDTDEQLTALTRFFGVF